MQRVLNAIKQAVTTPSWDAVVALLRLLALVSIARLFWRLGQPIWDPGIREEFVQTTLGIAGKLAVLLLISATVLGALVWGINRRLDTLARRTAA